MINYKNFVKPKLITKLTLLYNKYAYKINFITFLNQNRKEATVLITFLSINKYEQISGIK
jgi:hypothetical protein